VDRICHVATRPIGVGDRARKVHRAVNRAGAAAMPVKEAVELRPRTRELTNNRARIFHRRSFADRFRMAARKQLPSMNKDVALRRPPPSNRHPEMDCGCMSRSGIGFICLLQWLHSNGLVKSEEGSPATKIRTHSSRSNEILFTGLHKILIELVRCDFHFVSGDTIIITVAQVKEMTGWEPPQADSRTVLRISPESLMTCVPLGLVSSRITAEVRLESSALLLQFSSGDLRQWNMAKNEGNHFQSRLVVPIVQLFQSSIELQDSNQNQRLMKLQSLNLKNN
jgi:hypothetical protein